MQLECNAWAYNIRTKTPYPTISQKISKTKKFSKTPKPRSKMHEWMKNEGFRKLTKWSDLDIGQKVEGREIYVREKSLGWERRFSIKREEGKMKSDLHTAYIRKSHLDGSKYLLSTKSRQKLIHRGVVEDLSMTKIPRWIKKLSTMYRPDRNLFDGAKKLSRFYQEKT